MKNWHIKKQIMVLQIAANLFIAALVGGYILFTYNLIINQNRQSQTQIALTSLEILTSKILSWYSRSIQQVNYQSQQSITSIQLTQQIIQRYDIHAKENSGICKNFKKETNQFCYLIPNDTGFSNTTQYMILTNILESIKHQIPVEKLYFVSSQTDQYFSIYPTFVLQNYYPQSRPWYINHQLKKNNSLFILSDPYISMFSGVMFTETLTMFNQQKQQVGVIGHDYNMSSYSIFNFQIDETKISLIDQQGRLLISSYYKNFSLEFKFLQNETITGLNQSDFEIILNFTYKKPYKTQCKFELSHTLCLQKDNLTHQLIQTQQINNHILIFQLNETIYENSLELLIKTIEDIISDQLLLTLYFEISIICAVAFTNYLTQMFLSKPLKRLKQLIQIKKFQYRDPLKQLLKIRKRQYNWIDSLEQKVFELYQFDQLRKQNNSELISIQNIEYPKKRFRFPNLIYEIELLNNNKEIKSYSYFFRKQENKSKF